MIGIWLPIRITTDSIKNNPLIPGFCYSGTHFLYIQPGNTQFPFREIFYVTEESFIVAKFLSHLPNSLLRVINNDTYEEIPLVFNRLTPGIFRKNKVQIFIVNEF